MNPLVNQRTVGIAVLALLIVTGTVILSGGGTASGNHPNPLSVRPQCPKGALELPGDALIGATRAALKEASIVYRAKDRKGMKARNAHFENLYRSGYAAATCGKRAHNRTVVVGLFFPAERPSASLSTGVVMVSLFRDGYHIWAVKR